MMARKYRLAIYLLLPCLASSVVVAMAQSCGEGYIQQGGQGTLVCVPMQQASSEVLRDPGPQWVTRWGAIAVDGEAGKFGGVDGLVNKRKAKKAAIKECRKNGGKNCKLLSSYYNQCGVMAWGDNRYTGYTGPNLEQTIDLAVTACNKETTNCKPYYAGCSYPKRVR
jgi:Domain of unknown function (DUF4189)